MRSLTNLLKVGGLTLALLGCSHASGPSGVWSVEVNDPGGKTVTKLAIEFTGKPAKSCMAGDWKEVRIVSRSTQDASFFPISDPLSYSIRDGRLTIGRNEICDAYLYLGGTFADQEMRGDYYRLEMGGSTTLGTFKLSRNK